jgi:shikimate dehydrogenase
VLDGPPGEGPGDGPGEQPGAASRRCAVLGSPIGHSLSPVLHRAAYRELGLDWSYDAVDVTAEGLPGFVAGLSPQWRGLSLTMPLKRAVMPLLDEASATARQAGAANTVLLDPAGRRSGHNTDVPGTQRALAEHGVERAASAVVVGGGATATSAVLALCRMGCRSVTLRVREPSRAAETVQAARALPDPPRVRVARLDEPYDETPADIVVCTVPASAQAPLAAGLAERAPVVFDVVYDPWPTPLAQAAAGAGRTVVGGLDLLLHQGALQVELMTGCAAAPLAAMRAAVHNALAAP